MKRRWLVAIGLVIALVAAACGNDDDSEATASDDSDDTAADDEAAASETESGQDADLRFAMVTHGDGGSFWSVAQRGAEQVAADLGVEVNYQESNNDPERQAQLIQQAVADGVDGLAVSAPNPEGIEDAVRGAVDADIPVITLNSGLDSFEQFGAITHVGQTETIAGEQAGARLAEEGGTTLLCVIHEQGNIGLQERCDGAADGFGGDVEDFQVTGTADVAATLTEIQTKLQSDASVDAVLTLNPDIAIAARDAIAGAGSSAALATFDLSGDVVQAIEDGEISFAIDQQQYLQGYLPIVFLYLFNTNSNTVGGGLPVLTGPGFVDADNAAEVADLAGSGTR